MLLHPRNIILNDAFPSIFKDTKFAIIVPSTSYFLFEKNGGFILVDQEKTLSPDEDGVQGIGGNVTRCASCGYEGNSPRQGTCSSCGKPLFQMRFSVNAGKEVSFDPSSGEEGIRRAILRSIQGDLPHDGIYGRGLDEPRSNPTSFGPKGGIDLDKIDGFEFEKVCQRVLKAFLKCRVDRIGGVADKGRDLIVYDDRGTIIVECKHQTRSPIGRPVVQKLHSAMITSNTNRGMIITTGFFSQAAISYADKLKTQGISIDLVDKNRFLEMCAKTGSSIKDGGWVATPVSCYEFSDLDAVRNKIGSRLDHKLISNPARPSTLVNIINRNIKFKPVYEIDYDINAVFQTSIGIIHRVAGTRNRIWINGGNGGSVDNDIINFFYGLPRQEFSPEIMTPACRMEGGFDCHGFDVENHAIQAIKRRHTETVRYSGRNNVSYSKLCVPGERDILLNRIVQSYYQTQNAAINILRSTYDLSYLDHKSGKFQLLTDPFGSCQICRGGMGIAITPVLCNSCGAIAHPPKMFNSHSFKCEKCGKTLCRSCARYIYKYLIFKKILCEDCISRMPSIKGKKFPPFYHF